MKDPQHFFSHLAERGIEAPGRTPLCAMDMASSWNFADLQHGKPEFAAPEPEIVTIGPSSTNADRSKGVGQNAEWRVSASR